MNGSKKKNQLSHCKQKELGKRWLTVIDWNWEMVDEWGEKKTKQAPAWILASFPVPSVVRLHVIGIHKMLHILDMHMAKRRMKRCSTSLIITEMQIKTTMRYHLIWVRIIRVKMAIINKSTNNECWIGCGENGTFPYCWWECKLVQPLWKTVQRSL